MRKVIVLVAVLAAISTLAEAQQVGLRWMPNLSQEVRNDNEQTGQVATRIQYVIEAQSYPKAPPDVYDIGILSFPHWDQKTPYVDRYSMREEEMYLDAGEQASRLHNEMKLILQTISEGAEILPSEFDYLIKKVSDVVLGLNGGIEYGIWSGIYETSPRYDYHALDVSLPVEGQSVKIGFIRVTEKWLLELTPPEFLCLDQESIILVPCEWMIEPTQDPEVETLPGRRFQALKLLREIAVICRQGYNDIEAEIMAFDLYQAMIFATHPKYQEQINELARSMAWRPGLEMSLQFSEEDLLRIYSAGELLATQISESGCRFDTLFGIGSAALAEYRTGRELMSARLDLWKFLTSQLKTAESES